MKSALAAFLLTWVGLGTIAAHAQESLLPQTLTRHEKILPFATAIQQALYHELHNKFLTCAPGAELNPAMDSVQGLRIEDGAITFYVNPEADKVVDHTQIRKWIKFGLAPHGKTIMDVSVGYDQIADVNDNTLLDPHFNPNWFQLSSETVCRVNF